MGRKVHPVGFRVGVVRDWQAKWYADKDYVPTLQQDLKLRRAIRSRYTEAGISSIEIDRQGDKMLVNMFTSRPGVVIGRGGQRVDEMRQYLEGVVGSKVQLNIQEIRQPELDAYLVAVTVAEQIMRRVAYRRAMKQAIARTIEGGAKGIRISCSGRLAGAEIARREVMHQGQVPLQKLRADIDYGFTEAHTTLGRIGVKVWIYKGDILPEAVTEEAGEGVIEEAVVPAEAAPAAEEKMAPEAVAPTEIAPAAEVEGKIEKPVRVKKKVAPEAVTPVEAAPAVEVEKKVKKVEKPVRGRKKAAPEAVAPAEAAPAEVEEKVEKPIRGRKKKETAETTAAKLEATDVATEES